MSNKPTGERAVLTQEEIKEIIPHRDPILLADTVEELVPDEWLTVTFYVSPEREIFQGRFPDESFFSGVYTVECMENSRYASNAERTLLWADTSLFENQQHALLQKNLPGDILEIKVSILSERLVKSIATCSIKVYCHTDLAAEDEVTIVMR